MSMVWGASVIILTVLLIVMSVTQKKSLMEKEKMNQFECGFNTLTPSHVPFSFQFFLIAILFLIFDIEISLMLAYPLEPLTTKNTALIFTFILILIVGLIYEWQGGKINWSK